MIMTILSHLMTVHRMQLGHISGCLAFWAALRDDALVARSGDRCNHHVLTRLRHSVTITRLQTQVAAYVLLPAHDPAVSDAIVAIRTAFQKVWTTLCGRNRAPMQLSVNLRRLAPFDERDALEF